MVESLRTCAPSRVCSPSSPSAFSSHAVSSLAPSLPPSPLKRRIDLTSHFCFSFQHFMSLCPLSKVKGLFFYLPFTSCAWFWFIPPPEAPSVGAGGGRARARDVSPVLPAGLGDTPVLSSCGSSCPSSPRSLPRLRPSSQTRQCEEHYPAL